MSAFDELFDPRKNAEAVVRRYGFTSTPPVASERSRRALEIVDLLLDRIRENAEDGDAEFLSDLCCALDDAASAATTLAEIE